MTGSKRKIYFYAGQNQNACKAGDNSVQSDSRNYFIYRRPTTFVLGTSEP